MKNQKIYFFFILPSVALFCITIAYPFLSGMHIAFTDWDGISQQYEYIGLDNFKQLFKDTKVLIPIKNTLYYAFGYTIANNIFALILAVLLDRIVIGKKIFQTMFFIPMALSAVLAAFIWSFIYKEVFSALFDINSLLGNPKTVIPGIIIIALWNTIGSNMMIYIAGINNISQDYFEAASIDGANAWNKFWHITVPMLVPAFTICITLTLTTSLREFAMIMSATGGGPAGTSETLAIYIYRNLFSFQKAGYGQAVSIVFMLILIMIGTGLTKFFRSKEVNA